jgi:hypothetical protein
MTRSKTTAVAWIAVSFLLLGPPVACAGGFSLSFRAIAGLGRSDYEFSSIDEDEIESKFRPVFGGGPMLDWGLPGRDAFSLETGLLLRMKGGESEIEGGGTTPEGGGADEPFRLTWKQLSLTIPLLARVSLSRGTYALYLEAGPELGIPLSGTMEQEPAPPDPLGGSGDSETSITDIMVLPEVSILAGAGLQFSAAAHRLFAGIEYSHGLTDVLDTGAELRNRTISLVVGTRL